MAIPSPTPVPRRNKHPPVIKSPRLVPQPCENDRPWSNWGATAHWKAISVGLRFVVAARMHIVQVYSINANLLSSMALCAPTRSYVLEIEGINSTFNLALIHGICTIFLLADATRCRIISPLR
jgi:hypothetical protein